jgi:hypothetical protein
MKKLLSMSLIAAMSVSTVSFANDDLKSELDALKKEVADLKKVMKKAKIHKVQSQLSELKGLAKGDNLKFGVDFRTSYDSINYKLADGTKKSNDGLLTNRLWLNMAYAPNSNLSFLGRLSYTKLFGQTVSADTGLGYSGFDWVVNENNQNSTSVNVKQAYFLYHSDTLFGLDIPTGASIGRRPGTDGLLSNFREDNARQSALAHTINTEFDGFSLKMNLDKVTPLKGSWLKICGGKGISNADSRFSMSGMDYVHNDNAIDDMNMLGLIYVPYDNGQYSVNINYAKAWNMVGLTGSSLENFKTAYDTYIDIPDANNSYDLAMATPSLTTVGDMTFGTINVVANGIGEYGVSDFLDNTKLFASYAMSKTNPNDAVKNNGGMLGSNNSETGYSWWVGANFPCLLTDGNWGIEYNKGSKYWRSMTYAEDTTIGSKVAARGSAWEIYYNKPIIAKELTAQLRFTKINYDYTGSNSFFGADGTPYDINSPQAIGMKAVKEASDLRAYIRYNF